MANIAKQKTKLIERINQLEETLRTTLQKKAAGPAISVPKVTQEIAALKAQLAKLP